MGNYWTKDEVVVAQGEGSVTQNNTALIIASVAISVIIVCVCLGCCMYAAKWFKTIIVRDINERAQCVKFIFKWM